LEDGEGEGGGWWIVRRTSERVREVRWNVFWEGEDEDGGWRKERGESGEVGSQWTDLRSARMSIS
jgi:hypothetical protein